MLAECGLLCVARAVHRNFGMKSSVLRLARSYLVPAGCMTECFSIRFTCGTYVGGQRNKGGNTFEIEMLKRPLFKVEVGSCHKVVDFALLAWGGEDAGCS